MIIYCFISELSFQRILRCEKYSDIFTEIGIFLRPYHPIAKINTFLITKLLKADDH